MSIHKCTHTSNIIYFVKGHLLDLHHAGRLILVEAQASRQVCVPEPLTFGTRLSGAGSQELILGTHCVWTHSLPNMQYTSA